MKVKLYKKTTKDYDDIFTKPKETKEIQMEINDYIISIQEHQLGMDLDEPWVILRHKEDGYVMSMSFSLLIKRMNL